MSKVIGEGTYGCVHKPSLKCTRKKQTYTNKVSKLMLHKDAVDELKENRLISNVDKEKNFSLGKPEKCKPSKKKQNLKYIDACEDFDRDNVNDYSLLIMNDGGTNLKKFALGAHDNVKTYDTQVQMELFWIEVLRLFYGLMKFDDYDIIHYDLKPQNLVYNSDTNRINYIDFGFMTTKEKVKNQVKKSNYNLALWYWYYPFENMFLNYNEFVGFVNKSIDEKKSIMSRLISKANSKNDTDHFDEFYNYVGQERKIENDKKFMEMILNLKMDDYNKLIQKSIDTVDSYGLGLSLCFVLRKTEHLVDSLLVKQLNILFENMFTASLYERDDPKQLIQKYENILKTSGLLQKHNVKIRNHLVENRPNPTIFQRIKRTLGYVTESSDAESDKSSTKTVSAKSKTASKKTMKKRLRKKPRHQQQITNEPGSKYSSNSSITNGSLEPSEQNKNSTMSEPMDIETHSSQKSISRFSNNI